MSMSRVPTLTRRTLITSGLALGAVWGAPGPALAGKAKRRVIAIQPMGAALPRASFKFVSESIAAFYDFDLRILPRVPLPRSAYYRPRNRYRAEKLLDFLEQKKPDDCYRILGLTARDISTTKGKHKDWGILGLASVSGVECVISTFRCKRGAKNPAHTRERLGKVVVHELGHTFGLRHCPTDGCLMHDGEGTVKTVDTEFDLCSERCRPLLTHAGIGLSSAPAPWPDPAASKKKKPK